MKYLKYRNAARGFSTVVVSFCILAAVLYSLLTLGEIVPLAFDMRHLLIIAGVALLSLFISLILLLISCGCKKRAMRIMKNVDAEEKHDEMVEKCAPYAVEARTTDSASGGTRKTAASKRKGGRMNAAKEKLKQFKPNTPQKIAMIAVPAVLITTGIVIAGVKAKKRRKAKRLLRELERTLGL